MNFDQLMGEIREANLNYMLLAQQMLRADRTAAMYRLGIGEDVAGVLENLSPGQIIKMSGTNTLLCRFRFDDCVILGMLADHGREKALSASHAAILISAKPAEAIN